MTDIRSKPPSKPDAGTGDFYISAATSGAEHRPPRALKHGDTFAVFGDNGDVAGGTLSPAGLYYLDMRHLSHFVVAIDGERPLLLSSNLQDDNTVLSVDLANPDLHRAGRMTLPRDTIHVRRTTFLWQGACYVRLALHNFDRQPHRIRLGLEFVADFRDLFEIRGSVRNRRGTLAIDRHDAATVAMRYRGLDGVVRTTRFDFTPAADMLTDDAAEFDVTLAPGGRFFGREAGGAPRPPGRDVARRRDRQLQRRAQPDPVPVSRRSLYVADRYAGRRLPICGHSVVQHAVRPRWDHHGARIVVVRSGHRKGRAALSRRHASATRRSRARRAAGQDPA